MPHRLPRALGKLGRAAWLMLIACTCIPSTQADEDLMPAARQAADEGRLELAERLLTRQLEQAPEDAASRLLRAQVRSWAGLWEAAGIDYDRLLAAEPANADYLLGRAQVMLWSGSATEAAAMAAEARRQAPDYEALWRLEHQALLAGGGAAAEEAAGALAAEARERFPDSAWWLPTEADTPFLRVGMRAGRQSLNNDFTGWSSTVAEIERGRGDRSVRGRYRVTERFGLRDQEVGIGGQASLTEDWGARVEITYSPTGEVLPIYTVVAAAHRPLPDGWVLGLSARYSAYDATYAHLLSVAVEKYVGHLRFSYQLFRGQARDARPTLSHVGRADHYYGNGSAVGILLVNGNEQESLGAGRLVTTKVDGFGLIGTQRFGRDWEVTWALTRHRQGQVYRRRGIDVGFRVRL